jgi:hypothetical protein
MKQSEIVDYLIEGDWETEDDSSSLENFKLALTSIDNSASIHDFARGYNFDCGVEDLLYVLEHPKLDKSTVLAMYWMLAPGYFQQYETRDKIPSFESNQFNAVLKLHESLYFVQKIDSTIRFDPKDDDGLDWTEEYKIQMRLLPQRGNKYFYEIPKEFFNAV